ARLAGLGVLRRLVRGALEVRVAEAAAPAPRQHDALARLGDLAEEGTRGRVLRHGAERDTEDDVAGALARLHRALAGLAVAREVVAVVAEVEERVEVGVAFEEDRAALAAVAAVGPAARL